MPKVKENTKILVCMHKRTPIISDSIYTPIQVGRAIANDIFEDAIGDDTGDNISQKNKEYCELTALYWAWKNLKDVDIIGIAHYRRFLAFDKHSSIRLDYHTKFNELNIPEPNYEQLLSKYDVILPNHCCRPVSLKIHYCVSHITEDYNLLRKTIENIYPEYLDAFDHIMLRTNKLSVGNIFLMRWNLFESYAKWLFDILFTVEKEIKLSPYEYQQRVYGFMSERLIDIFCYYHQLKIKRCPLYIIDNKSYKRPLLDCWFKRTKYNFIFKLSSKRKV